jgi:glycosyltransferase involved in cell wall biosynthesis
MTSLVSCLMVTRNRRTLALRAIRSFLDQTWEDRELVIIDDSDEDWSDHLPEDPRIRYDHYPPSPATLGEMRNRSLEKAQGKWWVQWDDDDWSHPERIERQVESLDKARFGFLSQLTFFWPERGIAGYTGRREWECSMIVRRDSTGIRYPSQRMGEDTHLFQALKARYPFTVLDAPELYVRTVHDSNTWDETHFEWLCRSPDFTPFRREECHEIGQRTGYPG